MTRLSEFAEIRSGSTYKRETEGVRFVQIADTGAGYLDPKNLDLGKAPARPSDAALLDGDVLIAIKGRENRAVVFRSGSDQGQGPIFATLDLAVIRPDQATALPEFLALMLRQPHLQNELKSWQAGTGVKRLSLEALASVEIPLPPLERQASLVELASLMSAEIALETMKLELTQKLHQQLLRLAAEKSPAPGGNLARDKTKPIHPGRSDGLSFQSLERKAHQQ